MKNYYLPNGPSYICMQCGARTFDLQSRCSYCRFNDLRNAWRRREDEEFEEYRDGIIEFEAYRANFSSGQHRETPDTVTRMEDLLPWVAALEEALCDGEWHPREEIMAAVAKAIPPSVAYRVGERIRNRSEHRPKGPGPRTAGGDDGDSIHSGARDLARGTVQNAVRLNRIERKGDQYRRLRSHR